MNRRGFLSTLVGGVAATAAVREFPFRVYSFPSAIVIPELLYRMGDVIEFEGCFQLNPAGREIPLPKQFVVVQDFLSTDKQISISPTPFVDGPYRNLVFSLPLTKEHARLVVQRKK